jgi:hypothetical protein
MKKELSLLLVLVCAFVGHSQTPRTPRANGPANGISARPVSELPIRRVVLYSNGVAYIERRGIVTGDAEIDLSFKQSQIDDVLKSMVVLDLGEGRIGAVSYNSSQPASARTAEIPFSVRAATTEGGVAQVLSQMQGERVAISLGTRTVQGAILTVETRRTPATDNTAGSVRHFVVIATEAGEISAYDLAEVRGIKLLDQGSMADLNEFANATASTRRRDAKTISVTSRGIGRREMVVSYTISAPIWKTTYRVVLDGAGKPFFQGWAIVDNVSDEDWENVQLSLVSGSPVSFIQNLQKPLYRYRPVVPIPEDLNLRPQIYDPENPEAGESRGYGSGSGRGSGAGSGTGSGMGSPPPPKPMFGDPNSNFMVSSGFAGTSVSDALMNETGGIETAARGEELGNLFEYRIEQPVTVQRNRSALIPIVQTTMDGERVSIFRAGSDEDVDDDEDEYEAIARTHPRPMSGLLLKNTTAMTFEGGAMTILEKDAYAGEALMERLKPKEQRLISFALDLGTLIRVEQKQERQPTSMVKVTNGVFQVHYFKTDKRVYRLSNQTDFQKTVYIEHPVRKNWVLSESHAKPDYVTGRFYRFKVEIGPFESKELTVAENFGMMDRYNLTSLSPKDLETFVASRSIDDKTRARLARLIDLRIKINQVSAQMSTLAKESERIATDQGRFRENIEALAKTPEAKSLIARYIAKANEQESRLESIEAERRQLLAEQSDLERQLAVEIKNFEIG